VTSLFYFSAGVNTNRPWSSCTPHITAYLSSSDRRVHSGRGKYTRRGLIARILRNRKQRCLFGPHLTTAWSGSGNGDLRVVSCGACERITEIRDKDNCVLCARWARIDVPGDLPRPSSRKYFSIIRYFTPFFFPFLTYPEPNTSLPLFGVGGIAWSERARKERRGEDKRRPACVRSSSGHPDLSGCVVVSLYLFPTLFPFDNLTGCLRCRVASLFSDLWGDGCPGLLSSSLVLVFFFRDTDAHCD
jgi:hypothetical protein